MKKPKPQKLAETISDRKRRRTYKVCNKCQQSKPLTEFGIYYGNTCRSADGFRTECKQCRNKTETERLRAKRERIRNAKIQAA